MGQQYEPGTQHPMRPVTVVVRSDGANLAPRDAAPIGWSGATKIMTIKKEQRFMDDDGGVHAVVSSVDESVQLSPGIWRFDFAASVVNADATNNEDLHFAVTSLDGTTVHASMDVGATITKAGASCVVWTALAHLTTLQKVTLRFDQSTNVGGSSDLTIADDAHLCTITKVGNANEAGTA